MLLGYYCMQCVDKIQNVRDIVEAFSCRQHCDKFMNDASVQHATAGCIFGGRPTPTDARALSTQENQENQKIQPLPRYSYGGFETAHVDTS